MKLKRIYLEVTNSCNLDCPFCTNNKGNRFLTIEEIKNILPQIKKYSDNIYLHVLGEPLLHPNINEIFDEAEKNNLNINLVTNGTLLNEHLDLLNKKSLRKLSISIHSINNINIKDDYYKTILNIIENNSNKFIELRFYGENSLSNNNFLNTLKNKYALTKSDRENSYKLKDNTYILFGEYFKWPNINDEIINEVGYCHGGIDQIAILSNKDITLCCLDPYGLNKLGNLNSNSLKEILESEKYQENIKAFKDNKIINELCKKCSYRLKFFK